ncbi:translocation/assembly module TamB domain-containing protein [Roseibium aggregatum]|uniref:Translocation/assembly module TamB domain-containing protein n=1 Tax=Roseibium aggregatum TaxID=187304 RepID=A0A939EBU9_9HYPH|nr:translocation/assembly module TamB domain-containing protein [Roseibium aggregatum]MBN9670310.1 translocation/assembly module TamB domain-containing protein [Roseibium aggregatum]
MRLLSLLLRIFGFLLALVVITPLAAIGLLQVQAGRTLVSSVVSNLASTDAQTITVEDLYMSFGLNADVGRISVGDQEGAWLNTSGISLNWHPLQLISGDLDITSLSVERIDMLRLPAEQQTAATGDETESSDAGGFSLPVNVSLSQLTIDEINVAEPVLGAPVSLSASGSGSFALDPALITADLGVHRIDGIEAGLNAKAAFEPASETLAFDVRVSEPRGGLAARLLDVPDLPAVDLVLQGDGPLTDWAAKLELALDNRKTVTGSASLKETPTGRTLDFDLDGDLTALAPPAAQAFVLGTTHAKGSAALSPEFAPRSAQLSLSTQTVSLEANAALGNNTLDARTSLSVSAGDNALIAVDLSDRRVAFGPLKIEASVSGERTAADWSVQVDLASLQTTEARTGAFTLQASGKGADLSPEVLTTPFALEMKIAALKGLIQQTEPLSGPVSLRAAGTADGGKQTAHLSDLAIDTQVGTVTLNDSRFSAEKVSTQGRLSLADLSKFAGLAGRELGGSVAASFSADLDPTAVDGSAAIALVTRDLITGTAQADALLTGESRIDASIRLNGQDDIAAESLALKNEALDVSGKAAYRDNTLTSDLSASLADLSKVDPQLGGSVKLKATTSGPVAALKVKADASSDEILLSGTPLRNLAFSADATADPKAPTAVVKSSASLNGQPIEVDVELTSRDGGAQISPLSIALAGNTISGDLAIVDLANPVETLEGNLKIDAPDLASLSPLVLTDIGGRLQGTVTADPDGKTLSLDVTGTDIEVPSVSIGTVKLKADLAAPYAAETVTADILVSELITDATPIHSAKITAKPDNGGTALTADVKMDESGKDGLTLTSRFSQPESGGYLLALSQLAMRYQGISSELKNPTTVSYSNGNAVIEPLELQLGNGSFAVSGTAGQTLDLNAELKEVPLNLANAFVSSLGLGGSLSGTVSAKGSASAPEANWSITGGGLIAKQLKDNGLSALTLKSTGSLKDDQISQSTSVTNSGGLDLKTSGTVGLAAPNALAITLDGTVPTAAIKKPMLEAGIRADGAISLKGTVSGSAKAPTYQITATPVGLKVTSLSTGLTVQNIQGSATATQDRASLDGIRGELATGGTLAASGTVGLKNDFPADLSIKLDEGRYIDPGLVTASVDADVKIAGPLASPSASALISGKVNINKADISVPEYLPGSIPPVDVRHVNASRAVREQVAELGGETKQSQAQQKSNPPRLNIVLSAPGRIFVRGRGLDAELQGNLNVVGTTADPQAIGAFSLKRGQLDILTRRLVFSEGTATFDGSLSPILNFVATTTVSDTTITVTVSGEADDPQIAFSSSPELPQDEVLALLLFGKSVGNLSATQVARLAAAIATLTGGSDNGPLAQIRKSLGLDAIDINTDGDEGPSVAVGKYINDNIYLGVEQGTGSDSSRVKVDIDLDRGLKVRGEVGADGSSKAGIFFEKEY